MVKPGPYLLEGLGDEFLIRCADFSVIDDMFQVTDREAFLAARELALREGILAGGSSGAALWGGAPAGQKDPAARRASSPFFPTALPVI